MLGSRGVPNRQPWVQLLFERAQSVQLEDVLQGRWEPLAGNLDLGKSEEPLMEAAHKLWLLELRGERLQEEVQLLQNEQAQIRQHLHQRLAALNGAEAAAGTALMVLYTRERKRTLAILAATDKLLRDDVDVTALPEDMWEVC